MNPFERLGQLTSILRTRSESDTRVNNNGGQKYEVNNRLISRLEKVESQVRELQKKILDPA